MNEIEREEEEESSGSEGGNSNSSGEDDDDDDEEEYSSDEGTDSDVSNDESDEKDGEDSGDEENTSEGDDESDTSDSENDTNSTNAATDGKKKKTEPISIKGGKPLGSENGKGPLGGGGGGGGGSPPKGKEDDPESIFCKSSPATQDPSLTLTRKRMSGASPTITPSSVPTTTITTLTPGTSTSIPIEPQQQKRQPQMSSSASLPPLQSPSSSSSSSSSASQAAQNALTPGGEGLQNSARQSSVPAGPETKSSEQSTTTTTTTTAASTSSNKKSQQKGPQNAPGATDQGKGGEDPDLPKAGAPCSHILEQLLNEKAIFKESIGCSPAEVFRRFLGGSSTFYNDTYEEYGYTEIQATQWSDADKGHCGCKTREWSFRMVMSHKLAGNKPTTMRHVQTCARNTTGTVFLQQVSYMGKEVPYGDSFRPHALLRIEPHAEDGGATSDVTVIVKIMFLKSLMFRSLIERSAFGEMSDFFVNLVKKMKAQVEAEAAAAASTTKTHARHSKEKKKGGKSSSQHKKSGKRRKAGDNRNRATASAASEAMNNAGIGGGTGDGAKGQDHTALAIILKVLLMPLQLPVIFQGAIISVIISFVISNFVMYPTKAKVREQARQIQIFSDKIALLKSYCLTPLQQQQQLQSSGAYYRTQRQDCQAQDSFYEDICLIEEPSNEETCITSEIRDSDNKKQTNDKESNGRIEEVLEKLSQMNDLIGLLTKNARPETNYPNTGGTVSTEKRGHIIGLNFIYSATGLVLSIIILVIMKNYVL